MNDEKYNNLKEDQSISEYIDILVDVMKNSPQQRSNEMKNRKAHDKLDIDQAIIALDNVVNNDLLPYLLKPILPILNTQLKRLKKGKEYYIKNTRNAVLGQLKRGFESLPLH